MPTVVRYRAYRLFFYSNESLEPPHVHIERGKLTAKFWVSPVALAHPGGFAPYELNRMFAIVTLREQEILEAWHDHFTN